MSNDFWAGYLSGAASIIVGNPLDVVKVRLQASSIHSFSQTKPKATWSALKTQAAGLPAPILTYGALNALLFTTYNRALTYLPKRRVRADSPDTNGVALSSHFLAGAIAGLATCFISTPTEYIKCRAQLGTSEHLNEARSPNPQHSSLAIVRRTLRERGVRGLFLGGAVTSVRDAIGYGFWFAAYEGCKNLWDGHCENHLRSYLSASRSEAMKSLLCGGLAGVATWASVFPLDVVKTRVQTQPLLLEERMRTALRRNSRRVDPQLQVRGALSIAREAHQREGLGVFWRGLRVCCVRAFVVNAVQWSVYERAMSILGQPRD